MNLKKLKLKKLKKFHQINMEDKRSYISKGNFLFVQPLCR